MTTTIRQPRTEEGTPVTTRVEIEGLGLRYGRHPALDGLSLTLDGPKIYGLIGRNGSGKTSLLSVLAGFRRASAGSVRVDGEPVFENPRTVRRVCLSRESVAADATAGNWPHDRVSDALRFAGLMRPDWDAGYAAKLLDRFRVPRRTRVGQLSRGKRSALAVTLGLASRAPVTLFDEPHLGMDVPSRYVFYDELLNDYMAHPRLIVVSTHLVEELGPLFQEVVIIDDGRLLLHEDADALRSHGTAITGPPEEVDRLVAGRTVLGEQRLGPTKSVAVYGGFDDALRHQARAAGVELGPISLQDLFVHLTQPSGEAL